MFVVYLPTALIVQCPMCISASKTHPPHISSQNRHKVDYMNKRKTFHAKTLRGGQQKTRPKSLRKCVRELKAITRGKWQNVLQFFFYKFRQR